MRAKDYLLQISKIDKLIENKIAEREHWKTVAEATGTYSEGERVQSSSSGQKMADAVVRYVTIQEEIDEEVARLIDTRQDVIRTIEQLSVEKYNVLHKVYVQGMDLNVVAIESKKSYSWATTVHGRALQDLQKLLDSRKCDMV